MSDVQISEGDKVSWQWSGSRPEGKVAEVKEHGEVAIESHRGNTIKKNAEPSNPAVHVERSGNDVVKRASELDVEHKANGGQQKQTEPKAEKKEEEKKEEKKENGEAVAGEKRKADDTAEEVNGDVKKPKSDEHAKENGEGPKKKGRPAKGANGESTPKKKREPKKAATESGEPRRSSRHASKSS